MEINVKDIDYDKEIILYVLADLHVGNINTDLKFFEDTIKEIREQDNAYMLGLGDWIEGIIPTDPRFELDSVDKGVLDGNLILNEVNYVKKQFAKISDKIIGIHTGNHDEKIKKKYTIDFIESMCKELNVPYLGWSAYTKLRICRDNRSTAFTIYSTHGSVAGRRKGNKINRLEEMASWYDADMYFVGHSHDVFSTLDNKYYLNKKNNVVEKLQLFGNTGCFLKGIKIGTDTYAEKSNYSPNMVGYLKVYIYPELNKYRAIEVIK